MRKRLNNIWNSIKLRARNIELPLFEGLSLYDVATFFFKGIAKGRVTNRAASISYSFFLALFPGIIFLFSMIAFFPIQGLEEEIFEVFRRVLPPDTYEATRTTIEDILKNRRPDLLSFGFLFALIFATNGINSLISNFNDTIHQLETRGFWRQQLVAISLTALLSVMVIVMATLLIFSSSVLNALLLFLNLDEISPFIIDSTRFFILVFLVLVAIAFLYNFGPSKNREWRFISPGAILATGLIILSSVGFSFYVSNFSQYNRLYGSIGTLIVILLWIYINALVLIIGFELNASIAFAKSSSQKKKPEIEDHFNE